MIMTIYILDSLFNVKGMHAVFITLAHSMWIGAVMAVVAAIIMMLTKKTGPQVRYRLLTGLLALFILCMSSIFFYAFNKELLRVSDHNKTVVITGTVVNLHLQEAAEQKNVLNALTSFIQANAGVIVWIWLMIICFKCVQLISGLRSLKRLKKDGMPVPGDYWNGRLYELMERICITKPVMLLQSSLAKVPMVIGHLKPIILFPVGILNALPPDEVEAILLHELAHIKRNDFLINLLQQFAEIFFFFNPGLLWVSSLIKSERENCCDDAALSITKNKKIFINALVAFQEYNAGLNYTSAFPGSQNHLLNRVKRIITNKNKTLNNMEKLILASGIIITCLATVAFNPNKEKDKSNLVKTNVATIHSLSHNDAAMSLAKTNDPKLVEGYYGYIDTIPKQADRNDGYNINYKGDIDGKRVTLKEENSKIKELYIDGKKIPDNQYAQYQPLIDKIHKQMRDQEVKLKLQTVKLNLEKEQLEKQAEAMSTDAEKMKEQSEIAEADMEKQKVQLELKAIEMKQQAEHMQNKDSATKMQMQKMLQDFKLKEEEFQQKQIELKEKLEQLQLQQEKRKLMLKDSANTTSIIYSKPVMTAKSVTTVQPVVTSKTSVSIDPITVTGTRSVVSVQPTTASTVSVKSTAGLQPVTVVGTQSSLHIASDVSPTPTVTSEDIIRALEEEHVVNSGNNLSLQLNNESLIVNGVKQPEDIHQKILKKYQVKSGDKISLSYSNKE